MRLSHGMYPIAILFLFAVMIGCNKSNPPVNAGASTATLTGDWVVIADTAGQGHTGRLTLNPNGTFSMSYNDKHSNDSGSGKYIVGEIELSGQKFRTVELSIEVYNGRPAPSGGPLRLVYDPSANILHDFLTVAYARPDEVEQAKKLFERKTITSPSSTGANLKTRIVWSALYTQDESAIRHLIRAQIQKGSSIVSLRKIEKDSFISVTFTKEYASPGRQHPDWPNKILIAEDATLALWRMKDGALRKLSTVPIGFGVVGWQEGMIQVFQLSDKRTVILCKPPTAEMPFQYVLSIANDSSDIKMEWNGLGYAQNVQVEDGTFTCDIKTFSPHREPTGVKSVTIR